MAKSLASAIIILLSLAARGCHATPAATTTTTGGFPVITDTEGTDSSPDSSPTGQSGTIAGADGADGGLHLSTGAIVGTAVAIAIICIAFITLWALWFTAKRRNWAVRDTLKYASRRLTGRGAVPPTPKTPRTPHPARDATAAGSRGRRGDVERQWPTQKSAMKPHVGWLEEEKELSRSATPSSRGRR